MTILSRAAVSLVLLTLLGLSGCASSQLSPEERRAVRRVAIADVQLPDKPVIHGENAGVAFLLGGPIGLAIANGTSDAPTEFTKSLERGKTDVVAILREDLRIQLTRQGFIVVPQGDPTADAVLIPKVFQYGLTGDVTSGLRVPSLWLRIDLKNAKSGSSIWWNQASVHISPDAMKRLEPQPITKYFDEPAMLNGKFRRASQLITSEVFAKM